MKSRGRRRFILQGGAMVSFFVVPLSFHSIVNAIDMSSNKQFDVIIVGGSYSGLATAMALGRASRKVLSIDSGKPCNRQTPYSHNFLTQDGKTPKEISTLGKQQVSIYESVEFFNGLATKASKTDDGFEVQTSSGHIFTAAKLIFATGIKDVMPNIKSFSECWGISVLHCPYCHGYEVRNKTTGILGNSEYGFEFSKLISNWTNDLTLFTNGKSTLTAEQTATLEKHQIRIEEKEIEELEHINGQLLNIIFKDGSKDAMDAIYTRVPFEQHCQIPAQLGCELTEDGYIKIDTTYKTTIEGVFACGDNVTRMRTVANAVAMGTATGMIVSNELVEKKFVS